MKQFTSINFVLILILISCNSLRRGTSLTTFEVESLAKNYTDSLIQCSVDTILVFTKGCSGCIKGTRKTVYVFWSQNKLTKIRQFDSYLGIGIDREITDLTRYFFSHEKEIRTQKLIEPDYFLSHYNFTFIQLIHQGKEYYEMKIPEQYFDERNDEIRLVIWIQKIESLIYNLER